MIKRIVLRLLLAFGLFVVIAEDEVAMAEMLEAYKDLGVELRSMK